jgi:hypothetical protein
VNEKIDTRNERHILQMVTNRRDSKILSAQQLEIKTKAVYFEAQSTLFL